MNPHRNAFLLSALTASALTLASATAAAQVHVVNGRGGYDPRPVHQTIVAQPALPVEYVRAESRYQQVSRDAAEFGDPTADRYVASAAAWLRDAGDIIRSRGSVTAMRNAIDRADGDLRAAELRLDDARGDLARLGRRAQDAVDAAARSPRSLSTPQSDRDLVRAQTDAASGDRAFAQGRYADAERSWASAVSMADRVCATIEARRRDLENEQRLAREYASADARVSAELARARASFNSRTPAEADRQARRALDLQASAEARYYRGDVSGALRDLEAAYAAADSAAALSCGSNSRGGYAPVGYDDNRGRDDRRYDDDRYDERRYDDDGHRGGHGHWSM